MGNKSIYKLIDPRTGETRYVGASQDPHARLRNHRSYGHPSTKEWIKELSEAGVEPQLEVVSDSTPDWRVEEHKYMSSHTNLLNNKPHVVSTDPFYASVGSSLQKARETIGLTQADAAIAAGTTPSNLSRYESGTRKVPIKELYSLSQVYGESYDSIVSEAQNIASQIKNTKKGNNGKRQEEEPK